MPSHWFLSCFPFYPFLKVFFELTSLLYQVLVFSNNNQFTLVLLSFGNWLSTTTYWLYIKQFITHETFMDLPPDLTVSNKGCLFFSLPLTPPLIYLMDLRPMLYISVWCSSTQLLGTGFFNQLSLSPVITAKQKLLLVCYGWGPASGSRWTVSLSYIFFFILKLWMQEPSPPQRIRCS